MPAKTMRLRFSIASLLWLMLVVASFFLGHRFDSMLDSFSAPQTPVVTLGSQVNSDSGLVGAIVVDEKNFSLSR